MKLGILNFSFISLASKGKLRCVSYKLLNSIKHPFNIPKSINPITHPKSIVIIAAYILVQRCQSI